MPRLRRLSGQQVIAILERFGFEVVRIRGSHHQLKRTAEGRGQLITVPVHRNRPLPSGHSRPCAAGGRAITDCRIIDVFHPARDDYR